MDTRNNSGSWNSGHSNSGWANSGNANSGSVNSGNANSGKWNSGDFNSGNVNSGNANSGYGNTGLFNTDEPPARFFGKLTDIKMSAFIKSNGYPSWDGFFLTKWIRFAYMTDEEKKKNPNYKKQGGYLKIFEYKEAWETFWEETSEENRQKFLNLPNFDSSIFFEITGIDVKRRSSSLSGKEVSVTIDGESYVAILK